MRGAKAAIIAMQIIGICRSVTFVCIGAILFGAQSQGSLDLALLPVIDSINHKSSSQVSSFEQCPAAPLQVCIRAVCIRCGFLRHTKDICVYIFHCCMSGTHCQTHIDNVMIASDAAVKMYALL